MLSVFVCPHFFMSKSTVACLCCLCQPNASDQRVYTQASLCCHTGINRVWGCVNHSKPQKTHSVTHTSPPSSFPLSMCVKGHGVKDQSLNGRTRTVNNGRQKNCLGGTEIKQVSKWYCEFDTGTTQLYTSYQQHYHWCNGRLHTVLEPTLTKQHIPWPQLGFFYSHLRLNN